MNEAGPAPGNDPFGEQRDHIAIALAVGILSGSPAYINRGSDLAAAAYGLADTMIEHRRKANA